jgi:hypothetical protein
MNNLEILTVIHNAIPDIVFDEGASESELRDFIVARAYPAVVRSIRKSDGVKKDYLMDILDKLMPIVIGNPSVDKKGA